LKKGQTVNVRLDLFNTSLMRVTLDELGAVSFNFAVNLALGRQLHMPAAPGS
jgi:hypothetical protein